MKPKVQGDSAGLEPCHGRIVNPERYDNSVSVENLCLIGDQRGSKGSTFLSKTDLATLTPQFGATNAIFGLFRVFFAICKVFGIF
jgi:hypothetical protein